MKLISKAVLCLFFLSGILCHVQAGVNEPITATTSPQGWIIKTESSAYQIIVDKAGKVRPVFYGKVEQAAFGQKNALWFSGVDEVPVRGAFPDKTPMLEVIFSDNVRDLDLIYVSGDIVKVDGKQTLKITQKDKFYPLEVISYIRVLPKYDILEKWVEVKNTGKRKGIRIENVKSGSIVLPANNYMLSHMAGKHAHEFQLRETALTEGIKTLEAKDFKNFKTPPWYMVRPEGDNDVLEGPVWFGTIQYTGYWKMQFDKFFEGNVQIVAGINFWDTWWNLNPGEAFETPKFVTGFTKKGSEGAAQSLRSYTRETVLPARHRDELRPVLYNSWYATKFDVNEEQQLQLAQVAKDLGIEMFVIDDGWFKGRVDARGGLGDWQVDKEKFPNGLGPMITKINDMGMEFGIWIEPEMVNPNSDLYRAHPDWVLHFENRTRHKGRSQLVLNLAREDVYQNLLKQFTTLLKENNIKYIKWDHNRILSEPGWPSAPEETQREVRIRYINNLYRLIETLRERFPDVWFEACSGGGGRIDLGMLSRMDVAWTSDNTAPLDRLFIHYGFLNAFPANAMVSWVTQKHRLAHQNVSLEFAFDVSMSGVLGIGHDISLWTDEEKALAKKKVAQYKRIRPIVQQGRLFRLVSPYKTDRMALQYIADDTSVVFCYNMAEYLSGNGLDKPIYLLKLEGLNRDQFYRIERLGLPEKRQSSTVYRGDFLMEIGIKWPLRGANQSQILVVKPVEE